MKIGRNDPCWCGSGKKYKSCHAAFDDKLAAYQLKHIPVPNHKLIKTPEQLEGIRKAGKLNTAILDMVDTLTVYLRLKLSASRPDLGLKGRRQPILYVRVTFIILFRYRLPVAVQFQPVLF